MTVGQMMTPVKGWIVANGQIIAEVVGQIVTNEQIIAEWQKDK
jgi:hypothetical protein